LGHNFTDNFENNSYILTCFVSLLQETKRSISIETGSQSSAIPSAKFIAYEFYDAGNTELLIVFFISSKELVKLFLQSFEIDSQCCCWELLPGHQRCGDGRIDCEV
jgi:hypothetical protein